MLSIVRNPSLQPFKALQQSVLVIAQSIDKYGSIAMSKVQMFTMQDEAQTQAVCIIVVGMFEFGGMPLVMVKCFSAKREDHALMLRIMCSLPKGKLMQDIPCQLVRSEADEASAAKEPQKVETENSKA